MTDRNRFSPARSVRSNDRSVVRSKGLFMSLCLILCLSLPVGAAVYYVSPEGDDNAAGTLSRPFATLKRAISMAGPGTYIYLRGGTYRPVEADIMGYQLSDLYACVYLLSASGTASQPITISGYKDEKAVIDFSLVKPADKRVSGFFVTGDYWYLKNFEMIGLQVTIVGHTQSENISMRGGSNCRIERVNIHDGMGIGIYFTKGSNNLVLNCDAYNNYDPVSGSVNGDGGNVDGFGFHLGKPEYTGNVIRGCRAWRNSDDGIDLISNYAPVIVENCWVWENGYDSNLVSKGDGNGIKAGGYGMGSIGSAVAPARNIVRNCIAWSNKQSGFYSNHHLGGIDWYNNSAYQNKRNFNMVNRKSWQEAVDVDGYGHVLYNNLSYAGRMTDLASLDFSLSTLLNNTFHPELELSDKFFESLDATQLKRPRQADGSLPEITFLKLKESADAESLYSRRIGWQFPYYVPVGLETVFAGETDAAASSDEDCYDLFGKKIDPETYRGLYVRGGKKFLNL